MKYGTNSVMINYSGFAGFQFTREIKEKENG
jgi:hypothetical protein